MSLANILKNQTKDAKSAKIEEASAIQQNNNDYAIIDADDLLKGIDVNEQTPECAQTLIKSNINTSNYQPKITEDNSLVEAGDDLMSLKRLVTDKLAEARIDTYDNNHNNTQTMTTSYGESSTIKEPISTGLQFVKGRSPQEVQRLRARILQLRGRSA